MEVILGGREIAAVAVLLPLVAAGAAMSRRRRFLVLFGVWCNVRIGYWYI